MQPSYGSAAAPTHVATDRATLEALVVENDDLERLEVLLDQFNIFEAIGAVRQEVRHSDFLAFLLNPQQPHGLRDAFLQRLLQRVLSSAPEYEAPISAIDLDVWSLDETLVLREWQDIDILALDEANKLAILIENKIGSHEHSDQLRRYIATVQGHYPGWHLVAIYLTPEGELPSDERYMPVDYLTVCDVLETLVSGRASTLGNEVLTAITHYTRMLRRHVVGESEIAELCRRIYLKHQRALDLIYEYRPDRQTELTEMLKRLIAGNSTLALDHSTRSYVRFRLRKWDNSSALISGSGWTPSGRMLLFEFSYPANDLRLKLIIGPGPKQVREDLHRFALAHQPPFKVSDKRLWEKWNTIYQKPMVKDALSLDKSLEGVTSQLQERWGEFLQGDLQAIGGLLEGYGELWQ